MLLRKQYRKKTCTTDHGISYREMPALAVCSDEPAVNVGGAKPVQFPKEAKIDNVG